MLVNYKKKEEKKKESEKNCYKENVQKLAECIGIY